MVRKYAFCDESGAFGFDFEKENVSTHFLIAAIIIDEEKLSSVLSGAEEIRKQHFQKGEMKSSKIGNNMSRRIRVLDDLMKLDFNIYLFVADKRKIYEQSGLRIKKSFYKFLNQYVYRELRQNFQKLKIVADETGSNEYMASFSQYVKEKNPPLTLFDEFFFSFDDSKLGVLIQIADIICGSLSFCYDEHKKKKANGTNFKSFLASKILHIEEFPVDYSRFSVDRRYQNESEDDITIANICFRAAMAYKERYETKKVEEDVQKQLIVLNYLLFRFVNNSIRTYIPTRELLSCLERHGYGQISTQSFRTNVIAKLRDRGVIISSSSQGYKIPAKLKEIEDFIIHGKNIIEPMLARLRRCYDTIRTGSNGSIQVMDGSQYAYLKKY